MLGVDASGQTIDFNAVRSWTYGALLPFWAEAGVDRVYGGFLEEVSFNGEGTACSFKRVRTLCRQIYVFSHAGLEGFGPGEDLAAMGLEYLEAKALRSDGGWVRRIKRNGDVLDPNADLYDNAFVLFALAWRYKCSKDSRLLKRMRETVRFLRLHMSVREGFAPELPDTGRRLQNPIMHLMEASIAAYEATDEEEFLDLTLGVYALFERRLFNGQTLGERFFEDWSREPDQALEPGHHFEWAWILGAYKRLAPETSVKKAMTALVEFAETHGVSPKVKCVFDAVDEAGAPLRLSSRVWPNTERIKGWLAVFEETGADPRAPIKSALDLLFSRYIAGMKPGLWVDHLSAAGAPLSTAVPASIPYHFYLAFSELLRLETKLKALDGAHQANRFVTP
ncbi:MAG: AGE family epimerase/isomerase [Hyphomonadaceae bacterium]|nr:AGE family epimerase/isomerase [Hyphomonadaceae bacterium]MBY0565112.1 AGE family epimerase/isomerase [Hyphomonadaceae bacterium]